MESTILVALDFIHLNGSVVEMYSHGGRQFQSVGNLREEINRVADTGVSELHLCDISRVGHSKGLLDIDDWNYSYDLNLILGGGFSGSSCIDMIDKYDSLDGILLGDFLYRNLWSLCSDMTAGEKIWDYTSLDV